MVIRVRRSRLLPVLQILTALGLAVFWAGFFAFDLSPADAPPCYLAYEQAFPIPDMALAGALVGSAVLQLRDIRWAGVVGPAAGGALVFLGLLDVTFNLQNGIYALSKADLALNAFINLWSIGFGIALVVFCGRSGGQSGEVGGRRHGGKS